MDDREAISVAKTEFREAFNAGDAERLLSVFCDEFTDMSDDTPSFFGAESRAALLQRSRELFKKCDAEVAVIIIEITVVGDTAFDFGWHKLTLTSKDKREQTSTKYRYFETWRRQRDGKWKIDFIMTNQERPPMLLPES